MQRLRVRGAVSESELALLEKREESGAEKFRSRGTRAFSKPISPLARRYTWIYRASTPALIGHR